MTLALMGEGDMLVDGQRVPALQALQKAGITPLELEAKEGLALINGTPDPPPRWRCMVCWRLNPCWKPLC